MSDFPRMIYKKGMGHNLHGLDVDYRIVNDEREMAQAEHEGWRQSPAEAHREGGDQPDEAREIATLKAEIAKFDPDGDGRIGGSLPRKKRKKRR